MKSLNKNYIVTKITVTSNSDLNLNEGESEKIKKALLEDDVDERLFYFHKNFDAQCGVKAGDVYLVQFQNRIGTEISGEHFAVAIINSRKKDRNVMIIPLTSLKEGKQKNPKNSVYLGVIKGINNGKESIALINQVQSIDKKRLLKLKEINEILRLVTTSSYKRDTVIKEINKVHYRLTDKQYYTLVKECKNFMKHNARYGSK